MQRPDAAIITNNAIAQPQTCFELLRSRARCKISAICSRRVSKDVLVDTVYIVADMIRNHVNSAREKMLLRLARTTINCTKELNPHV